MSQDITHLPPASSPHYPCRQHADWRSPFNRNSKDRLDALPSHAALSHWLSPQNYAARIHLKGSLCLWQHGRMESIKREWYIFGTTKTIYLLHQACQSKESFCFQRIFGLPLDSLCFTPKWLTLNHSNLPWSLGFSDTSECTITV